jgi:predicted deacylase
VSDEAHSEGPVSFRTATVGPRTTAMIRGKEPGPTLIAVGGIHGNEPGGVAAGRRLVARLEKGDVPVRGEVIIFLGNMGAQAHKERYIVRDLNRVWNERVVGELEARPASSLDPEEREQAELLVAIREVRDRARGPVFLVDLHTTSAAGVPFVIFGDTLAQRAFVLGFPLPVVFGLEEQLDGALAEYWTRHGCVTFSVEGGQHDDPASVDNLEAVLLLACEMAGIVPEGALPETKDAYALLESRRGALPRVMEVLERHAIEPEDDFRMEAGFRNLDYARAGQLLATDRAGDIRAPQDGLVILPLYQKQGKDGFFWGRAVSDSRLRLSERLRLMNMDRLLPLLPGVRRDESHPSRFIVNTKVARLFPVEVFHMFGYRRIRRTEDRLTVERQPG